MKINKSELAKKCGVSRQTIHAWLQGQSTPTIQNMVMLAKALAEMENRPFDKILGELIVKWT
tara:strand:- start:561 stop:746 length:186 start_codon:yes stop_codon:yes gene_type:complete